MKTWKIFGLMALLLAGFSACSDDNTDEDGVPGGEEPGTPVDSTEVVVGDSLQPYLDIDAYRFYSVLRYVEPEYGRTLGNVTMSEADLAEFKRISDEWCAGLTTDREKAEEIWRQVSRHLSYGGADQGNPVDVWNSGLGNCYGYSNTYKAFCYVQEIPCIGGNGKVYSVNYKYGAGHSWSFAYFDGEWWLMDALWEAEWRAADLEKYGREWDESMGGSWQTLMTDVVLAEDETFVPANVKRITIGANISNLGEEPTNLDAGCANLNNFASNVEWFDVAEGNELYESYEGTIYREGREAPLHVPGAMKVLKLKPVSNTGKEFLRDLPNVEEIWFGEGTGQISSSAIENCPNLKKVYVPEGTQGVSDGMFGSNVEIVRY